MRKKYGHVRAREQKIMSREERLRAPPRFEMPWRIRRSAVKEEELRQDPWWFVLHRRGLRRPKVGEDPLEARAVSKEKVYGSILERIIYRWLTMAHIAFDFQSSLQGGRMELGGLVADFILPDYMYVLNPIGPTHQGPFQFRKDEEQRLILAEMGYTVFYQSEELVHDEFAFEDYMRRLFNFPGVVAGNAGGTTQRMETIQEPSQGRELDESWDDLQAVRDIFEQWQH